MKCIQGFERHGKLSDLMYDEIGRFLPDLFRLF